MAPLFAPPTILSRGHFHKSTEVSVYAGISRQPGDALFPSLQGPNARGSYCISYALGSLSTERFQMIPNATFVEEYYFQPEYCTVGRANLFQSAGVTCLAGNHVTGFPFLKKTTYDSVPYPPNPFIASTS